MNAMPQPRPDQSAAAIPSICPPESLLPAGPVGLPPQVSLSDAISTAPDAPPPHLLWATLESAYATPDHSPIAPEEARLPPHLALPLAVGLSLVLWVIIVELVMMR